MKTEARRSNGEELWQSANYDCALSTVALWARNGLSGLGFGL